MWVCARLYANTLFPQAEMAQDTLDDCPIVDEGDNSHFAGAFRAQQRVGFTHLFDKLAPLGRRDPARFVF